MTDDHGAAAGESGRVFRRRLFWGTRTGQKPISPEGVVGECSVDIKEEMLCI